MPEQPILRVEGFAKSFTLHEQNERIPASQDVNLELFPGQLSALSGPTGVGKSSVLKGIYRSYLPSRGRLLFHTEEGDIVDLACAGEHRILELRRTQIGFVTQFLHALPRQATQDVVAAPLLQRGMDKAQARERAHAMLAKLNLPQRLWGIPPATFSGGEKQRVNLARGIIARPRLLLLDEPTASLDPKTTGHVLRVIEDLKGEGIALLAIFHDPKQIERVADTVVRLRAPSGASPFPQECSS